MDVHPTAVIAKGADLGEGVQIGPYCVIGPRVRLGDRCRLHAHVVVDGDTEIGPDCECWPNVVLGTAAQHREFDSGSVGGLRIGARNRFREGCTVHTGTPKDQAITRIGNDNMFLAGAHVAHDAIIGDHVTMTNGAMTAGHSIVEDRAVLGALVGLHQFARIGRLAMIGGGAMVARDAPPFSLVQGDRAKIRGVNLIGLRRAGVSQEDVAVLKRAFRMLFWRIVPMAERVERTRRELGDHAFVAEVLHFLQGSKRGVIMARGHPDSNDERLE